MRTAEIGNMQLGKIGRDSKWCIPTFLKGVASHRKYRILLTFSRFRVQVPRNLPFREPLPLNPLPHKSRRCLEPINAMWKKTHSVWIDCKNADLEFLTTRSAQRNFKNLEFDWLYPDSAKLNTIQRLWERYKSSHYSDRVQGVVYERDRSDDLQLE